MLVSPPTIGTLITRVSRFLKQNGVESYHLDARLIVAHSLGLEPIDIFKGTDLPVDPAHEEAALSLMRRRASGVPVAYITGKKEFWSLSLSVDERVLIPRPETEILVEESLTAARLLPKELTILELGVGSGAVSIALAVELTHARVVSTDISSQALAVAEANVSLHGLNDRITLRRGNLFEAIGNDDRFDLVVSNPPYLTDGEMKALPPDVAAEPGSALSGGSDGLSVIRCMVAVASGYMSPGGFLIFEIGAGQEDATGRLIENTDGLSFSHTRRDYAGKPRVVVAKHTSQ